MDDDTIIQVWLIGADIRLHRRILRLFELDGGIASIGTFPSLADAVAAASRLSCPSGAEGPPRWPDAVVIDTAVGNPGWHLDLESLRIGRPGIAAIVLSDYRPGGRVTTLVDPGLARFRPRRASRALVAEIRQAVRCPVAGDRLTT
jgi:hypothetical protein